MRTQKIGYWIARDLDNELGRHSHGSGKLSREVKQKLRDVRRNRCGVPDCKGQRLKGFKICAYHREQLGLLRMKPQAEPRLI